MPEKMSAENYTKIGSIRKMTVTGSVPHPKFGIQTRPRIEKISLEILVLLGLAFLGLEMAPGTLKIRFCSKNAAQISVDHPIWIDIKPCRDIFLSSRSNYFNS